MPPPDRSTRTFFSTPAVQALLIQFLAALLLLGLVTALRQAFHFLPPFWLLPFGIGLIAAIITRCRAMPWWWLPIQFCFAPALFFTTWLDLPAWLFLAAFLLLLSLYWTTYRTQVPLYLSGLPVWQAVLQLLPARPLRIVDIGCGLGGLVLHLAQLRTDCSVSGIELAPMPWLISAARGRWCRSAAQFFHGDYRQSDLAHYDVVVAYLSPAAMPDLWRQVNAQMRPGSMLISYEFDIADRPADRVIEIDKHRRRLHVWYVS